MRCIDRLATKQPLYWAFSLSLTGVGCNSAEQETRSYVNEGVLCHTSTADADGSDRELHVIFDQCASYCAEVLEATCEVNKDGNVFRVEARATTKNSADDKPCPAACNAVAAKCGFVLPSADTAEIEFGGERFSAAEIGAVSCSGD